MHRHRPGRALAKKWCLPVRGGEHCFAAGPGSCSAGGAHHSDISRSIAIKPGKRSRILLAALILTSLAVLYWVLAETGTLDTLSDRTALREWIGQLGGWGPVALIGMMIIAIVLSPIPSGPIAIAAGAVYGPLWGTVFVVIGSEAGALIAFTLARTLGFEAIQGWSRVRPVLDWLGKDRSQAGLMVVVFASRLVPFISFDAVSYAAGLTPLAFWRFLLATLAGVIPTAYLIAAFGDVLMTGESGVASVVLILISVITLVPFIGKLLWDRRVKQKKEQE